MGVRLANDKDKKSLFSIMGYSFNSGNRDIEYNISRTDYDLNGWLVNEENNIVTSAVKINEFDMMFDGKPVKMGGVGGVCSAPEYRNNGGVKNILTYSLNYMREKGIYFSALGPFAYEFYRKYGWEWGFTYQLVNIPVNHLKDFPLAAKYVPLTKDDNALIESFRLKYIKNINGPVIRSENMCNDRWGTFYNNFTHTYASYDENDNITAIAFFRIDGKVLRCEELYFLKEIGRQHMLRFFFSHRSQVDEVELQLLRDDDIRTILPTPRIRFWEWANMMVRVIDVKAALELLNSFIPFKENLYIKVIDEQAEWNHKTFKIKNNKNNINVEISNYRPDFEITIQRLSQLILGFTSGKQAVKLDHLKVLNEKKLNAFYCLFQKKSTMIWQPF